jgi:hypothetical protein
MFQMVKFATTAIPSHLMVAPTASKIQAGPAQGDRLQHQMSVNSAVTARRKSEKHAMTAILRQEMAVSTVL